ncbi:MAG: hypothetical protein H8E64_00090 [Candidatus Marinimicrobia bacterium]|nr:hypothetical protein [Candidatus Neomarinimicrobiota bacterium]
MVIEKKISQLTTVLLLLVYFIASSPVLHPLIEYVIDYQKIVTEKCELRAKPELAYHGECYLKDQIAKSVNVENDSPCKIIQVQKKIDIDPHCFRHVYENNYISFWFRVLTPPESDIYFLKEIDHPPQS